MLSHFSTLTDLMHFVAWFTKNPGRKKKKSPSITGGNERAIMKTKNEKQYKNSGTSKIESKCHFYCR